MKSAQATSVTCLANRLGQAFYFQVFNENLLIVVDDAARGLVEKISSLITDPLMKCCERKHGFSRAIASSLAASHAALIEQIDDIGLEAHHPRWAEALQAAK